jgi:hypothetical protein
MNVAETKVLSPFLEYTERIQKVVADVRQPEILNEILKWAATIKGLHKTYGSFPSANGAGCEQVSSLFFSFVLNLQKNEKSSKQNKPSRVVSDSSLPQSLLRPKRTKRSQKYEGFAGFCLLTCLVGQ